MPRFRQFLFWLHLATGLVAGLVIGVMCLTGAALAFEKDLVAWSQRDARRVTPPGPDGGRLPLRELEQRLRAAHPDARPTTLTISADPADAVVFAVGRERVFHVDPYRGDVRTPASRRVENLMQSLEAWHRTLALPDDAGPVGKAINGACNFAFCLLAITGLYLWWPRHWNRAGLKAITRLNLRLAGKARDFNWHNTVGLWCAPVLIVLTLTALPISYRWAGDLVYRIVGETPPPPGQARSSPTGVTVAVPAAGAVPLTTEQLFARVIAHHPRWTSLSGRLVESAPDRKSPPSSVSATTVVLKERGAWPRTAITTLSLDPFTGELLKTEGFDQLTAGRQIRGWMRFLHTGEALGTGGQLVAGLASLGGVILVYTGFALSWLRFVRRKPPHAASTDDPI